MSDFDETTIIKIAKALHEKYAPVELLVNQIVMTENGVLVIFILENQLPPRQRIAMFDANAECKWDNPG